MKVLNHLFRPGNRNLEKIAPAGGQAAPGQHTRVSLTVEKSEILTRNFSSLLAPFFVFKPDLYGTCYVCASSSYTTYLKGFTRLSRLLGENEVK